MSKLSIFGERTLQLPHRLLQAGAIRGACRFFSAVGCLLTLSSALAQSSVTLAWEKSPESNITGYRVYHGVASRTYTNQTYVSGTNATIQGLVPGVKYYFAVAARNSGGLESAYSMEVTHIPLTSNNQNPTNTTPDLGLVAAYAFEEGAGTTTKDFSGGGNVGMLQGATWSQAGRYGKALSFNGTSSSVLINDSASLDATNALTLEAWVYPLRVDGWREVIYKGDDNYYLEAASTLGAGPGFGFNGTSTSAMLSGPTALPTSTWSHLAATYDGATMRLFVNGTQVASRARTGPIVPSTLAMTLGADTLHGSYFAGLIDEVRVYRRVLTVTEIQKDMATPLILPDAPTNPPPAIALTSPASGGSYVAPATIQLGASVTPNGQTISKVQFYSGTTLINEDASAPYSFSWGSVQAGSYQLSARALYGIGNSVTSSVATVTVTNMPTTPPPPTNNPQPAIDLPLPWRAVDIGNPAVAGSAYGTNGLYTVAGSGSLNGSSDGFRFVYQPINGDGEIRAKVSTFQGTAAGARVGVMIRETLNVNSRYSFMGLAPENRVRFQSRSSTGGNTWGRDYTSTDRWVRLVRSGQLLHGYTSADGANWTLRNSRNVSMAASLHVGLAVASGSAGLNTATITNVFVIP